MQGSAAQTSAVVTGQQAADTQTDDTAVQRPSNPSVVSMPETDLPPTSDSSQPNRSVANRSEENTDPGRATTPTQTTGQHSGQSSVVTATEVAPKKDNEKKPLPWEQQSASQSKVDDKGTSDTKPKPKTKQDLPWQQQSSAKPDETSSTDAKEKSESKLPWEQQSATQGTESKFEANRTVVKVPSTAKIRRVIIDPATGLYVETSLGSLNNSASEKVSMSFDNRQEDLLEWPFWEMSGRIGLTVAKNSYNGSVSWEQDGSAIDFRFRGPLGFGGIRIHGDLDEQVRVKTTTGQDFTVTDFENEMQAKMGWSLPINSLRYWALGIVDPELDADVVLNEDELLEELVQGDWKVTYERYKDTDGVMLPSKFRITGPSTKIKMLVNEWSIPSAE